MKKATTKKRAKSDRAASLIFDRRPMQFPVRLTVEEHGLFRELSGRLNVSMSHLVRQAIVDLLVKKKMMSAEDAQKIMSHEKKMPTRYVEPDLED